MPHLSCMFFLGQPSVSEEPNFFVACFAKKKRLVFLQGVVLDFCGID